MTADGDRPIAVQRPLWAILSLACGIGSPACLVVSYRNRAWLAGEPGDDTYFYALMAVPGIAILGLLLGLLARRVEPGAAGLARFGLALNGIWALCIVGYVVVGIATFPASGHAL